MSFVLNRRRFSAGLALAPLATGGALSGCSQIPDRVKIGVAQPLTGPIHELGKDLLNGVQLAVTELNAANYTINGKRVTLEVVAVDDKSDAETGKAVAQQLVEAGVVAVIGHLNSGVSIAAAPIYAAQGMAQIAISTNPKFTELGLDTTFRMVANDHMQAKAMGSYAGAQFGDVPYAAVDDGTPYGKGLIEGAARELKARKREIVLQQSFDDKTVAFDDLAARIKAAKVGVIVSTLNDFQVIALIEALRKVNHTDVRMLGGDTLKTTGMLKARGTIRGIHATSPVLEAKEFLSGRAFLSRYTSAFKIAPAYGGHYTYDSTYVLTAAMQKAKSAEPKDIIKAMRTINGYAPVIGTMSWDDKGEQRYAAVGVYDLGRDGWNLRIRSDTW